MLQTSKTSPISKDNFDLVTTYCVVDDFFRLLLVSKPGRKPILSVSEYITICLIQHTYEVSCLKRLYELVRDRFSSDFKLPDYKNFVLGINQASKYMLCFTHALLSMRNTSEGDVCFVDSTKLEVCKIYREHKHKTMKLLATKSKSTTGWFYGFRLHVICDKQGNLMRIKFTTATKDERVVLEEFMQNLHDSVIVADAGYVSCELSKKAGENQNILLAATRKNMRTLATIFQNKCMNMRSRIETVFDVLKERYGMVSSLPRSVSGYFAHYIRSIFSYLVLN